MAISFLTIFFCITHQGLSERGSTFSPALVAALDFVTVLQLAGPMDFESLEGLGLKWLQLLKNLR